MSNQLAMDKSFAINNLRAAGYSERRIAQTLGVSRGAVRRHLQAPQPNSTTAPTGSSDQAPIGSQDSNSTKAQTGSSGETPVPETAVAPIASGSQCEPFRELNCRVIRTLLKRQSVASQTTMDFMEDHTIIRSIGEYAKFIHEKVQEGIYQ